MQPVVAYEDGVQHVSPCTTCVTCHEQGGLRSKMPRLRQGSAQGCAPQVCAHKYRPHALQQRMNVTPSFSAVLGHMMPMHCHMMCSR